MPTDKVPRSHCAMVAANDNGLAPETVEAALTRIAEAIGRHIARDHIRVRTAANDNEPRPEKPTRSKR